MMPIYTSECPECGLRFNEYRSVAEYRATPKCEACHGPTFNVMLEAPQAFVKGKFEPFISSVDRTLISTQNDLNEHNKRNNVVNVHDGYSERELFDKMSAPRDTPKVDKKEVAADIAESIKQVQAGYKPTIEAQDD